MKATHKVPFPDHLRPEAEKLARHEIGHWIVSRRLGFRAGDVTGSIIGYPGVGGRKGTAEITLIENLDLIAEVVGYLERRIKVCWAGAIAEALDTSQFPITNVPQLCHVDSEEACKILNGEAGQADARIARELLQLLRNVKGNSLQGEILTQLERLRDTLWSETVQLVEDSSDLIVGVAANLASRIRLAGLDQMATISRKEIEELPSIKTWLERYNLPSA